MSSTNNRFGRRSARHNDDLRAEPVLSFNAKRPPARVAQNEPAPPAGRKPQAAPRAEREDAGEFGTRHGRDQGPRIERDDDFDPRGRRKKALETRVPEAERPLYHHLFDEQENRRRGFGLVAALGSVAVIAIGVAFAWHNFMARPAPAGLFGPPGFATRGNNTGYMTPAQPPAGADTGSDGASAGPSATPSPLVTTRPTSPDQQPTRDVAATPVPKSVPYEPPPPPKKSISEAAANPGKLGLPATNGAVNPVSDAPPPAAKKEPVAAPAPILTPPVKREAAGPEPKREAPRKEASITPPKRAPAPQAQDATPPAMAEPAVAPAVNPAPLRPHPRPPQATGQPQPLNRNAPANYAPPAQQQAPQQQPQPNFATQPPPGNFAPNNGVPSNAGPPANGSDTVTVDGVTYVNGQEPHSLGTVGGLPPAPSNDAAMPPGVPAMPSQYPPPGYSTRSYAPADHDGGAPLPNDVIILPNGQMAVPNGR